MTDWYLNRALTNFRSAVNARWPNRDKTSDGTIGDPAHQSRTSDHNPDPDGSVDAWDMDVDGVDVQVCIHAFEAHESSKYWIYNDQISFRSEGWAARSYAYAGTDRNRHTKHVHFNTRESHEDSNAAYYLIGGTFMALSDAQQQQLYDWAKGINYILWQGGSATDGTRTDFRTEFYELQEACAGITKQLNTIGMAMAAIDGVNAAELQSKLDAVKTEVTQKIEEARARVSDAVANVDEAVVQQLGLASPDIVARALVAAGQDPIALATALTRIAQP